MSGKHYTLLLKKQMLDALPTKHRNEKLASTLASSLLMTLLVGVIIAVFVVIFSKFINTYTAIKINRVLDIPARQFEIMSAVYFVLIVSFVFSGVTALCHSLFENSDLNILITMPFSGTEIFLSKLTAVFLKQLVISLMCVTTVNFTFFCSTGTLTAYNGIMTFVVAMLLPIIPLGIASIIVLPYFYLKKLVNSHYFFVFVVMTAVMVLFCVGYSYVFKIAEGIFTTGKITSLFNESTMTAIGKFTKYNYPANLFAYLMLGKDIGKNFGILAGTLVAAFAICLLTVRAIFVQVSHSTLSFHIPHARNTKPLFIKKSRMSSLLSKEFLLVMRTPSYAYMYFTTAIIMPIMAYYSAKISLSVLSNMLGNIDVSLEVCTFIVLLYSTLTNTFCSTNISRDGYMTMMQKTLPYSPTQILGSKMIFCSVISILSIAIACIVLAMTNLLNPIYALIAFISATLLALAQIVYATRLDLRHPHFSKTDDGEIKEANSTVSSIIFTGLIVSFLIGFALLFNSVKALIMQETTVQTDTTLSIVIAIVIPFVLLAMALVYFFINLKRDYANLDAEG